MTHDAVAIETLFALPFSDLIYRAQTAHRRHFDPNAVQLSTLVSIKTGGCSEDSAVPRIAATARSRRAITRRSKASRL